MLLFEGRKLQLGKQCFAGVGPLAAAGRDAAADIKQACSNCVLYQGLAGIQVLTLQGAQLEHQRHRSVGSKSATVSFHIDDGCLPSVGFMAWIRGVWVSIKADPGQLQILQ